MAIACEQTIFDICLSRPPADTGGAIFGFAEFLAALALLVLVFNSTDYLYKFRVSVAPLPLFRLTFGATAAIGAGTLLTDLWFAERWYAVPWGVSRAEIQAFFGGLFLATALLWMWFAFIRPPVFGRWNYKHFYDTLYRAIVKGSDAELSVVASELARSGASLVRLTAPTLSEKEAEAMKPSEVALYAHRTLLLIANRKLCRHIVASSPVTAIVLMIEASRLKRHDAPLGEFASKITTEALLNKDSILFHEDKYAFDVIGHEQPFTNAMYGNYQLVEGVGWGMSSPLDIDWRVSRDMDGDQFEAYCRITAATLKNYFEKRQYHSHSYSLYRAIDRIEGAGRDLYKLDKAPPDTYSDVATLRLEAAVRFVDDVIKFLGKQGELSFGRLRVGRRGSPRRENIFDDIAKLMFELIHSAGFVRAPNDRTWWIQHNTVWSEFFNFRENSPAWKVIRHKLFRLLYDEIRQLEEFPNYKGARILGFCLNVLGVEMPKKEDYGKEYYPLKTAVISWTKRKYLWLIHENPDVAEHCLAGTISFDAEKLRLVKTYRSFNREPSQRFLQLDRFTAPDAIKAQVRRRRYAKK